MGMGYSANFADTVKEEFVKQQCPKEFEDFMLSLEGESDEERDISLEQFAMDHPDSLDLSEDEKIRKSFYELCDSFKTKTGLELHILHHDSQNNGDRYDDVDGVFWVVSNAYELTDAGKKNEKDIERKLWVVFG